LILWFVIFAATLCFSSIGFALDEAPVVSREYSFECGGRTRSYLLHVPSDYGGKKPMALVIVFHGGGSNAKGAEKMTGFSALADKKGFMVVYPNGIGRIYDKYLTWNAGNCCGYALDQKVDDIGFIASLIEKLEKEFPIDPDRIYATGISNGAMMVYRLACELSDKIAAIAPVAGALNNKDCFPMSPVSVIAFHGSADQHVLYNGGRPQKRNDTHERKDSSVAYAMDFWAARDTCEPRPEEMEKGRLKIKTWTSCLGESEVSLYTIIGGGHAWPGAEKGSLWGNESITDVPATVIIWDFFDRHPKGGR
jgi:polyhydroxybutyrate depolymerase